MSIIFVLSIYYATMREPTKTETYNTYKECVKYLKKVEDSGFVGYCKPRLLVKF